MLSWAATRAGSTTPWVALRRPLQPLASHQPISAARRTGSKLLNPTSPITVPDGASVTARSTDRPSAHARSRWEIQRSAAASSEGWGTLSRSLI